MKIIFSFFTFISLLVTPQISLDSQFKGDELEVSVQVTELSQPVLGAAFHLNYNSSDLEYIDYQEGDFFKQSNEEPIFLVSSTPGAVYFGSTLKKGSQLIDSPGRLVSFRFKILRPASNKIGFSHTFLADEQGNNISVSDSWLSSTIQANTINSDQIMNFKPLIIPASLLSILVILKKYLF